MSVQKFVNIQTQMTELPKKFLKSNGLSDFKFKMHARHLLFENYGTFISNITTKLREISGIEMILAHDTCV